MFRAPRLDVHRYFGRCVSTSTGVPGAMRLLLLVLAAVCAGGRRPAREAR